MGFQKKHVSGRSNFFYRRVIVGHRELPLKLKKFRIKAYIEILSYKKLFLRPRRIMKKILSKIGHAIWAE
jgi:hypothetical protein